VGWRGAIAAVSARVVVGVDGGEVELLVGEHPWRCPRCRFMNLSIATGADHQLLLGLGARRRIFALAGDLDLR
jgi:hypothetical protein